jgi:putative transposase
VSFIDEHKQVFGVEPICRVLSEHDAPIAPSTYYAAKSRPPSARAVRDARLKDEITRVWKENYEVYGADKVWLELNRQGTAVARCTVERVMRDLGLRRPARAEGPYAVPGRDGHRAGDRLNRDFTAPAPDRRWVADFTYVPAWSGIVYVAFVVDVYSRAVVGRSAATHKRAKLVLDALQMALWRRDRDGARPGPAWCTTPMPGPSTPRSPSPRTCSRLASTPPSAVGDAYDNALMESTIGLYKTELIKPRGRWRSLADVELATAEYVDWYNNKRLHTAIGGIPAHRTRSRLLRSKTT